MRTYLNIRAYFVVIHQHLFCFTEICNFTLFVDATDIITSTYRRNTFKKDVSMIAHHVDAGGWLNK